MATDQAKVKSEKCGATVDLFLETDEVNREKRQMGAEIQYDTTGEATCECGNEIEYIASEYKYPEGVPSDKQSPKVTGGILL